MAKSALQMTVDEFDRTQNRLAIQRILRKLSVDDQRELRRRLSHNVRWKRQRVEDAFTDYVLAYRSLSSTISLGDTSALPDKVAVAPDCDTPQSSS